MMSETAADVLRRCQMPPDEIRWALTAEDPRIVHMILELHRERLEEELAERRKALGELEVRLGERSHERTHQVDRATRRSTVVVDGAAKS